MPLGSTGGGGLSVFRSPQVLSPSKDHHGPVSFYVRLGFTEVSGAAEGVPIQVDLVLVGTRSASFQPYPPGNDHGLAHSPKHSARRRPLDRRHCWRPTTTSSPVSTRPSAPAYVAYRLLIAGTADPDATRIQKSSNPLAPRSVGSP